MAGSGMSPAHCQEWADDIVDGLRRLKDDQFVCMASTVLTEANFKCMQFVLAKDQREMMQAYEKRLKIIDDVARQTLISAQSLWAQSTDVNCKFFGNGPESAATYQCLIKATREHTQALQIIEQIIQ
jgi:uncharacterized protein YecT (DUF1311 family)